MRAPNVLVIVVAMESGQRLSRLLEETAVDSLVSEYIVHLLA